MTGGDNMDTGEPLGMPKGSVRLLLSLGVVIGAFAIAAYLLAADRQRRDESGDRRLDRGAGNVIGFYFGVRSAK